MKLWSTLIAVPLVFALVGCVNQSSSSGGGSTPTPTPTTVKVPCGFFCSLGG